MAPTADITGPAARSRWVKAMVAGTGACAVGIARAGRVAPHAAAQYAAWVGVGGAAGMDFMARYADVRLDPRLLLDPPATDAWIVVAAYPYFTPAGSWPVASPPLRWARYALGRDYHLELRERLGRVAMAVEGAAGARCRVCVDTAPLLERYWAVQAGLGRTGRNGLLAAGPGYGSWVLLASMVTDLPLLEDAPAGDGALDTACLGCRRCVDACPGGALNGDGTLDARRCRSYMTVEMKGDAAALPSLHGRVYGCDICQEVCPRNNAAGAGGECAIEAFAPRPEVLALDARAIEAMTQQQFSEIFRQSAVKRCKLAGLQRNARHLS